MTTERTVSTPIARPRPSPGSAARHDRRLGRRSWTRRGFAVAAADAPGARRPPLHRARGGADPGRDHRPRPVDGVRADRGRSAWSRSSAPSRPSPSVRRCARSSGCATRSRASPARGRRRCSRCLPAATSWPSSPRRSTGCSSGCAGPTPRAGPSSPMPGTSCAARSPRSGCCSTGSPRTARCEERAAGGRAGLGGGRPAVDARRRPAHPRVRRRARRADRRASRSTSTTWCWPRRACCGRAGCRSSVHVEPARVMGDAARLGRVVRNLLENAERHRDKAVRLRLSRRAATRPCSSSTTTGPPSPWRTAPASSPGSCAWTTPAPATRVAPGSAWRSSPRSSRRTVAR